MLFDPASFQSTLQSFLFGGSWALPVLAVLIGSVLLLSRLGKLGRI